MGLFKRLAGIINTSFQLGFDSAAPLLKRTARVGNCDNLTLRNPADNDYGGIELDQIVIWNNSKTYKTTIQLRDGGSADVIFTLPRTDGAADEVLGIVAGNSALQWVVPKCVFGSTIFDEDPVDKTIVVCAEAVFPFTINGIYGLKTSAGTLTLTVKINGTNVTGLASLSVTSSAQDATATAANTVAVGDRVTIVITSSSGASDLEGQPPAQRATRGAGLAATPPPHPPPHRRLGARRTDRPLPQRRLLSLAAPQRGLWPHPGGSPAERAGAGVHRLFRPTRLCERDQCPVGELETANR